MIHAQPPFARPPPLTAESTAFYEHELDAFNAILAKPYAELTPDDAEFVIADGELFIPPLYLRYLLPAVSEAARSIAQRSAVRLDFEQLARLVTAAAPIEDLAVVASGLRAALGAAVVGPRPQGS